MSPTNTVSSLNKELITKVRHLYKNLYDCHEIIEKLEQENKYFKETLSLMNQPTKTTAHIYAVK
jgi:hypothetical protein